MRERVCAVVYVNRCCAYTDARLHASEREWSQASLSLPCWLLQQTICSDDQHKLIWSDFDEIVQTLRLRSRLFGRRLLCLQSNMFATHPPLTCYHIGVAADGCKSLMSSSRVSGHLPARNVFLSGIVTASQRHPVWFVSQMVAGRQLLGLTTDWPSGSLTVRHLL